MDKTFDELWEASSDYKSTLNEKKEDNPNWIYLTEEEMFNAFTINGIKFGEYYESEYGDTVKDLSDSYISRVDDNRIIFKDKVCTYKGIDVYQFEEGYLCDPQDNLYLINYNGVKYLFILNSFLSFYVKEDIIINGYFYKITFNMNKDCRKSARLSSEKNY